jgi:hypothetical protein
MSYAQTANAPPGFAVCPACQCCFEDKRVYRVEQIATLFGVKPNTVKWWMRSGKLPFRLWAKGGGNVQRVVIAKDLDLFLNIKLGKPGDGSVVAGHWAKMQEIGAKGRAQLDLNRAARAQLNDPSTPTSDQDPKP